MNNQSYIPFNIEYYLSLLDSNGFGSDIDYFDSLESTNTVAKSIPVSTRRHGKIILTNYQTAGKGRSNRKWFSPPGTALTFTLCLNPDYPSEKAGIFSIMAGVSVAACVQEFHIPTTVKWPNDIQVHGKKISGILAESQISQGLIKSIDIGIGLNVNEATDDFPLDLQGSITSMRMIADRHFQREKVLAILMKKLSESYHWMESNNENKIIQSWLNDCTLLDQPIAFHHGTDIVSGVFRGITPGGEAVIDVDGDVKYYSSGEIV